MERKPDFVVVTQGICFLCRHKIEIDIKSESILESIVKRNQSANQSIQYISRYLKMDMSKVFIFEGAIPPHLLEKVKRSRLKVELCDECSHLNETFSKLFWKLQKAEIEIASCLGKILRKLANADKVGKGDDFHTLAKCESKDAALVGKLKIAEALRADPVEKCNQKAQLSRGGPRVRVKKLSPKDIPQKETTFGRQSHEPDDAGFSEIEVGPGSPDTSEKFDGSEGMEVDYTISHSHSSQKSAVPKVSKSQCTVDSKTGKVKCNACSKEFGSYMGFYDHYKTAHLKIRFKCDICHADFSRKWYLITHKRSVHLGERVKCRLYSKTFTSVTSMGHHLKAGCNGENQRRTVTVTDHTEKQFKLLNMDEVPSDNTKSNFKMETEGEHENLQTVKLEPLQLREGKSPKDLQ